MAPGVKPGSTTHARIELAVNQSRGQGNCAPFKPVKCRERSLRSTNLVRKTPSSFIKAKSPRSKLFRYRVFPPLSESE